MSGWNEYRPTVAEPWLKRRVVHLHRRAVFGACRSEIERDLTDGPAKSISRILDGSARDEGTLPDFEQRAAIIGESAVDSGNLDRLRAWWVFRLLFSPDPLRERLTLMWHNHFATSNDKVKDPRLMRLQNESFRKLGMGPFGELLRTMAHDPALLIWLDAPMNKAGKPNENLAREIMELFTLGIGNYQETDVRESARALTGFTVRKGNFYFDAANHDAGEKRILGQTGKWNGDDFVRILLEHKATPERLAWRLVSEFFADGVVDAAAKQELAQELSKHNLDIRWGVETILRSQLFFSEANLHTRVSDPASFLLMPLRALEYWRTPISTLVLAEWLTRLVKDCLHHRTSEAGMAARCGCRLVPLLHEPTISLLSLMGGFQFHHQSSAFANPRTFPSSPTTPSRSCATCRVCYSARVIFPGSHKLPKVSPLKLT